VEAVTIVAHIMASPHVIP